MPLSAILSWLQERAVSLWLWPLNLIRDFPGRFQRLRHTISTAVTQKSPLITAIHLVVVQLFDLFGGPELAQIFLRLLAHTSPLTATETAVITNIIGINLRFQEIRLAEGGLARWIFRFNGNLAFTAWHTIFLPQTPVRSRQNLPLLVHEVVHVYQYEQVGTRYLTEAIYMLITTHRDCYAYGGVAGLVQAQERQISLSQFNREQQAQIVQDFFAFHKSGQNVAAYLPYIDQLRNGRL